MCKKWFFFLVLLAVSTGLVAQQDFQKVQLTLHLKNGDVITGDTDLSEIVMKTDFGRMEFPIDVVNSIEVGLADSRIDKSYLLNLLEQLDGGSEKQREKAFDEVIAMEEGAIPFVRAYLDMSENQGESQDLSVETAYQVMLAKYNIKPNFNINDVLIYKDEYSLDGRIEFDDITIDAGYARLKIERNKIKMIDVRLVSNGMENNKMFKVFANQHVSGNKEEGWLNTGILVKQGQELSVTSSGQIVLASLSGNMYTPDGGVNGTPPPPENKDAYGAVLFRIGRYGKPRVAGEDFKGEAERTGIVYISIYEAVYNPANSGYYTTKVRVY